MPLLPPKKNLKVSVLAPDLAGGGTTRVYLLARVLQQFVREVNVVGLQFGDTLYPTPPEDLTVSRQPGFPYPQVIGAANTLLSQIDGDIIYAVKPKPTSFGLALLKKLRHKCPIILDIDDWEMSWFGGDHYQYRLAPKKLLKDVFSKNGELRQPNHPLYIQWTERLIRYADAITVDTRFLQQRFGGVYLPNGKDTDLFDPDRFSPIASREKYGLADYRVLMFPGTVRPHKGLEEVLIALDQLNQPDLRLVLVGGRKPDDYEDSLLKRWGQWIIKLPRYPIETMPEIVSAAHIVVVPQRNALTAQAQFPLKLTDGMAMAKPILATKVGDIPEILGDTGYLVDAEHPGQMADTIQWIFEHFEEANQRGLKARQRCLEHYSAATMTHILTEIMNTLR